MFERYTEKARRVIFFARYEASMLGSQAIDAEHILLGLMREDRRLFAAVFSDPSATIQSIRKEIENTKKVTEKVSASVDLPLSAGAKRVLSYAADESDKLEHRHIGTEHLLLGLLEEKRSPASEVLSKHGVTKEKVIASLGEPPSPGGGIQAEVGGIRSEAGGVEFQIEGLIHRLASRQDLSNIRVAFDALLDVLVSKGVISEEDRREITKTE